MKSNEFISRDSKAPRESTWIVGLLVGTLLIVFGVVKTSLSSACVGIVLFLALFLGKTIAITDEGLVTTYKILFINKKDVWPMDEIAEIHKELSPDGTEMGLHVMRGIMSKRLIYPIGTYQEVIDFILEHNSNVHVAYINK